MRIRTLKRIALVISLIGTGIINSVVVYLIVKLLGIRIDFWAVFIIAILCDILLTDKEGKEKAIKIIKGDDYL